MPSEAMSRDSTTVESRCRKVVAGDGSVKSSAGTYTAWIEGIEPTLVEVVTYRFRGSHDGGLPRFASFVRVREDMPG